MSAKSDYNKEEWLLLYSLPASVGLSVLIGDDSGMWGTTKETVAVSKAMAMGVKNYPANPLIQTLLTDKKDHDGDPMKDVFKDLKEELKQKGVDNFISDTAGNCGKAAHLLAEKSDDKEAAEYKEWVMGAGQGTAEAAKEKGPGDGKVSDKEKVLLEKFAAALGIKSA